ncbi:MAG: LysM peptidoglycan-binding domain-containing protein [Verrucomicrobiota bacterium]
MNNKIIKTLACAALVLTTSAVTSLADTSYTVESGDNLSKIGKLYGVSYQDIMDRNGLSSTVIHPGQTLIIPTTGGAVAGSSNYPAPAYDRYEGPTPPVTNSTYQGSAVTSNDNRYGYTGPTPSYTPVTPTYEQPAARSYDYTAVPYEPAPSFSKQVTVREPNNFHTVRSGETVASISRLYGVKWHEIRRENGILFNRIYPGQKLMIPSTASRTPISCEVPASAHFGHR